MKLKVTKDGEKSLKDTKEENRKRGKRSRTKGANFERTTAKKFKAFFGVDLVRTPQSGGFAKKSTKADDFRGDITSADKRIKLKLHIECKNAKSWSLPAWIKQAEGDCPKDRKPIVVFHQHGTSKDYVALSLNDFFDLVTKDKIISEEE